MSARQTTVTWHMLVHGTSGLALCRLAVVEDALRCCDMVIDAMRTARGYRSDTMSSF